MDESIPAKKLLMDVVSSTHWLTLMTCTVCNLTPDEAPVYKCQNGHPICATCYRAGFVNDLERVSSLIDFFIPDAPTCNVCHSYYFKKQDVSTDFLRKLKAKPGIGRSHRYILPKYLSSPTSSKSVIPETTIPLDTLFCMPMESVHQLMQNKIEDRLQFLAYLSSETGVPVDQIPGKFRTSSKLRTNSIVPQTQSTNDNSSVASKYLNMSRPSYEPYRCVDDRCGKVVAKDSFDEHYSYEHHNLPQLLYVHSTELTIPFDIAWLDYGKTICICILRLVAYSDKAAGMTQQQLVAAYKNEKLPGVWVMVSGSQARPGSGEAHMLCWVFSNVADEDTNKMTIELASHDDILIVGAHCSVNSVKGAQDFQTHPNLLNSLYVNYRTLKRLVAFGPDIKLRISLY